MSTQTAAITQLQGPGKEDTVNYVSSKTLTQQAVKYTETSRGRTLTVALNGKKQTESVPDPISI